MAISAVHFALTLLVIGFLFRLFESKFPDNPVAKALMFIY